MGFFGGTSCECGCWRGRLRNRLNRIVKRGKA